MREQQKQIMERGKIIANKRTDFVFQWDHDDLLRAKNTNVHTHFISSGDKTQSCYYLE